MSVAAIIIQTGFQIFSLVILVDIVVGLFLNPYHPVRSTLDRIVNPLLNPIRKIMPKTGMFDFSPMILLILLNIVEYILLQFV
jgi:YggT family protein